MTLLWIFIFFGLGLVLGYVFGIREPRVIKEDFLWNYRMIEYIQRHAEWSFKTFGPCSGDDHIRLCRHIEKELAEIRCNPLDCEEWVDVMILAIDGAVRSGHSPLAIAYTLREKQETNTKRTWPKPTDTCTPIEHMRMDERETNP